MQYDRIANGLVYFTIQGPQVETDILKPVIISCILYRHFMAAPDIGLNESDKGVYCYDLKNSLPFRTSLRGRKLCPEKKYLLLSQKAFDFCSALWYTFIRKLNALSWSSGQDVALSRRNQGFDSPREYQKPWNHNVPRLLTFLRYSVYHFLQGKLLCRAYSHDRIESLAYIVGSGIQCCHSSAVKSADCSCILSTPPSSGSEHDHDRPLIGRDKGLKNVYEMMTLVAPLKNPVLILGETGTGKEVVADTIHKLSLRNKGPFIKVNCGAISPGLLDSELFGHKKSGYAALVQIKVFL